jgi:hypothetical protein
VSINNPHRLGVTDSLSPLNRKIEFKGIDNILDALRIEKMGFEVIENESQ